MKKFFMIVLAVVIGLAFVTTTFAQDKAPAPDKKAEKAAVAADKDKAAGDKAPADAKDKKPPKKAKKKAPKKDEKKEEKKDEAKKDEAKPAPAK